MRNKHNHFRELPDGLRAKLGPLPDGFLRCAPRAGALNVCPVRLLSGTLTRHLTKPSSKDAVPRRVEVRVSEEVLQWL